MEKEMNDATSGRRLRPPVYPRLPTTTNVTRAGNSIHQYYSRRRSFLDIPATTTTPFSSQAGPGSQAHQLPPSLLSRTTHASAGGSGGGSAIITVSGSGCAAGSSSHQVPPSLLPQTHSSGGVGGGCVDWGSLARDASQVSLPGSYQYQMPPPSSPAPMALDPVPMLVGGVDGCGSSSDNVWILRHATFLSSLDTGLASVVGLEPFSSSVDLQESSSSSHHPLLTQSMARVVVGPTGEYELPPLPPSLSGLPAFQAALVVDLVDDDDDDSGNKTVPYVDLEGPDDGLNSSGHDTGLSLADHAPADAWVKKETVDCSSWGTSQMGNSTIASGDSSSPWMPQPYSSVNTGNGITQAPWKPSSSSIQPHAANDEVKKEAMDNKGKNIITSGGSSSTLMPEPYYSDNKGLVVSGSKPNMLPSLGTGWSSKAGSSRKRGRGSNQYEDEASPPFVKNFSDGLFTQSDITKIMAEKNLANIVLTDPKRVRIILRNRRSADIYAKRKKMYLADLERKVEQLEQEKELLSLQVHSLQSATILLRTEKNEMMMKLQGFMEQTQQWNDMNVTLNAEVCRLKLVVGEIMDSDVSRTSYQEMIPQMTQQEQLQIQNDEPTHVEDKQEKLTDFENFFMP